MQLSFTKMQGLGNDFMVVLWPRAEADPTAERVRQWADRRLGIGFDSLLMVDAEAQNGAAASYRVFNADGGEAEQCGNGVRCIASLLAAGAAGEMQLKSAAGLVEARVLEDGRVSVNLGVPSLEPRDLPFETTARGPRFSLALASGAVEFGVASMGNPHAVIPVDSVDAAPVGILGEEMSRNPAFPDGVNVGFMQLLDRDHIRLRVFERGVGETRACGTGAAAAMAIGRSWGMLGETVEVSLPGGELTVEWPGPGSALWQTGPASKVYEGRIEI